MSFKCNQPSYQPRVGKTASVQVSRTPASLWDDWARAGVGEAPRHEVAGNLAVGVQRALWRLRPDALVAIDVPAHRRVAGPLAQGRQGACVSLSGGMTGQHRHSVTLEDDRGTSSGGAGREPACAGRGAAAHRRAHDVSILITAIGGDGRCLGICPRSKTSMTIMRPPQHGHGRGNALG